MNNIEEITISMFVNGVTISNRYYLRQYIPVPLDKLDKTYSYFKCVDDNDDGWFIQIRNNPFGIEVDFNSCHIDNYRDIGKSNTTFFMKGTFYKDKQVFRGVRTGNELVTSITKGTMAYMLAQRLIEIIKYVSNYAMVTPIYQRY